MMRRGLFLLVLAGSLVLGLSCLRARNAPGEQDAAGSSPTPAAPDVRITGPPSTQTTLRAVAAEIKREQGLVLEVSQNLTGEEALQALSDDKVDIAIMTKPFGGLERAAHPDLELYSTPLGMQVAVMGVSSDLWDSGFRAITKENMRAIYELKTTNWHEAGGPDEKVKFYNLAQGQGIWEIFAEWLYGDNRKAPLPKTETLATSADVRDALEFTPGAIGPMGAGFADGSRCHALGIDLPHTIAKPMPEQVASGDYPMVRPILAMTVGRPTLAIRAVTEFLTGPKGQALIKASGAMGVEAVPTPTPEP